MRLLGLLGLLIFGAVQPKQIELHGLKPGMLTREIILYSHAPIDTMMWGGSNGVSILRFHGSIEKDSGEFRITVNGTKIERVLFVSRTRDSAKTRVAFEKMQKALTKRYGNAEEYHNTYHMWTWDMPGQQLKLSTMDRGLMYTIMLVEHGSPLMPSPDNRIPPRLVPAPDNEINPK
jgi:hypothetical protein